MVIISSMPLKMLQMEVVPHAVFLSLKVSDVISVWSHFNGYVLNNFQSVGLQSHSFHGVVCEPSCCM